MDSPGSSRSTTLIIPRVEEACAHCIKYHRLFFDNPVYEDHRPMPCPLIVVDAASDDERRPLTRQSVDENFLQLPSSRPRRSSESEVDKKKKREEKSRSSSPTPEQKDTNQIETPQDKLRRSSAPQVDAKKVAKKSDTEKREEAIANFSLKSIRTFMRCRSDVYNGTYGVVYVKPSDLKKKSTTKTK